MKEYLHSSVGQTLAIAGTLAVHAGVAAWAMQPTPPMAIPQQQVIQVAMIAQQAPKQERVEPTTEIPAPAVVPEEKGMVKVKLKPKKVETHRKPEKESEKREEQSVPLTTSGPQEAEAEEKHAAITQPFDAAYLRNPPPVYPASARRQHIEGKVLLKVEVTPNGDAETVTVAHSSGSNVLDEAARLAVEKWRFIPARRGTEAIAASVAIPIIFKMKDAK